MFAVFRPPFLNFGENMNKTTMRVVMISAAVAAAVVYASNNVDAVEDVIG